MCNRPRGHRTAGLWTAWCYGKTGTCRSAACYSHYAALSECGQYFHEQLFTHLQDGLQGIGRRDDAMARQVLDVPLHATVTMLQWASVDSASMNSSYSSIIDFTNTCSIANSSSVGVASEHWLQRLSTELLLLCGNSNSPRRIIAVRNRQRHQLHAVMDAVGWVDHGLLDGKNMIVAGCDGDADTSGIYNTQLSNVWCIMEALDKRMNQLRCWSAFSRDVPSDNLIIEPWTNADSSNHRAYSIITFLNEWWYRYS